MKKVQIDGPFTKQHCIEYMEDIANGEGVTLISVQFIPSGVGIYDVAVIYENGVTPTLLKADESEQEVTEVNVKKKKVVNNGIFKSVS